MYHRKGEWAYGAQGSHCWWCTFFDLYEILKVAEMFLDTADESSVQQAEEGKNLWEKTKQSKTNKPNHC